MHSFVLSEFVYFGPQNQILLSFPRYLELTYFCFLTQVHFHHFLHKKVNHWWDSKEGGNAVVCNLFNSGSSDLALFRVLG